MDIRISRVFKYTLPAPDANPQDVSLPVGAVPLSVHMVGEHLQMWALVSDTAVARREEHQKFVIISGRRPGRHSLERMLEAEMAKGPLPDDMNMVLQRLDYGREEPPLFIGKSRRNKGERKRNKADRWR